MAQSKATKKFEKNKLKDTLGRRKEFAKIKQRHQVNDKRKAKKAAEEEKEKEYAASQVQDSGRPAKKQKQQNANLGEMSVDDFFAGDFELPKPAPQKKAKAVQRSEKKRAREEDEEEEEEDDDDDAESVGSLEDEPLQVDEQDDAEDDGADDDDTHKQDLNALKEKDPEFYKYLQEEDPELLNFAEDAPLDEIDELSNDEEDESKDKKKKKRRSKGEDEDNSNEVTKEKIGRWSNAMTEKQSLRAMREVVLAFRAAAHLNEENGKDYRCTISNADVYHEVLLSALQHIPAVLNHHLPIKEMANGKIRVPTDSKKFRTLTPMLKSHASSLQHLLENLSDVATLKITLTSLLALQPYLLTFKKLIREITNTIVGIWAESSQSEATRISAFLVLRRLIVISDPSIREHILRSTYQGLIKGSRTTTIHNIGGINLMKNSSVELWGLVEPSLAYTSGFTFIRQLAIHLRSALKNNSNDSYKTIYNWQYTHSLDFWSRVLSTHCETLREATLGAESPLRPLIYPLVQVTLGALRLVPTSAYFPLRFHLTRSLLRLSRTTNTYIPLAASLYEVLTSNEMRKPPKPSTLKPLDFDTNIRATKAYLRTRIYQDGVGEQVVELLSEFFALWGKSIAFPELALPVVVMLKRWLKEVSPYSVSAAARGGSNGQSNNSNSRNNANTNTKHQTGARKRKSSAPDAGGNRNSKLNASIALLISKLDANSKWIEARRAKVEFAPNNRTEVEAFLKEVEWTETPLGAFVEGQRKVREARKKVLEEARREREEERKGRREGKREGRGEEGFSDDDAGSGGEDEEEEERELEVEGEMEDELEDEEEDEDEGEMEMEED